MIIATLFIAWLAVISLPFASTTSQGIWTLVVFLLWIAIMAGSWYVVVMAGGLAILFVGHLVFDWKNRSFV